MSLSNDLISQFVEATANERETSKETTVYGTTVEVDGAIWVKLDGSNVLTPISTTAATKPGERVTVMIKDHSATITGNITSPSARTDDVKEVDGKVNNEVARIDQVLADKVSTSELSAQVARIGTLEADNATIKGNLQATSADIETLRTANVTVTGKLEAAEAEIEHIKTDKLDADAADLKFATIGSLDATNAKINNLDATYATIENLEAATADIDELKTKKLDANTASITYATIANLNASNAEIDTLKTNKLDANTANLTYATIANLNATNANISELSTKKLDAETANVTYATIDFANIGEAAIKNIFGETGMIKDLVVGSQTITGELVGVTISGDLIKGNTIQADKLVVRGDDGLYYKLNINALGETAAGQLPEDEQAALRNGLHGSNIIAKTITAEAISVNDLVAFGATIGGYHITNTSLYSGVKSSATNTTTGVYFGSDGQFAVGDSSNFLKFYKNSNGNYILEIAASSIKFGASSQSVESAINSANEANSALANRVGTAETSIGTLNNTTTNLGTRVGTAESNIGTLNTTTTNLGTRVGTAESNIGTLNTTTTNLGNRVTQTESDLQVLSDSISMMVTDGNGESLMTQTANGWTFSVKDITDSIDGVNDRVGTAESNIGTLNTTTTNLGTRVGTAETNIGTLNDTTENLGTRVGTAETNIGTLNDTTAGLDTRVGTSETNINDLTDATSALDDRLGGAEESVNALNTTTEELNGKLDTTNESLGTMQEDLSTTKDNLDGVQREVDALKERTEYIRMGIYEDEPCIELGEGDSDFKVIITNTRILFMEGSSLPAYITNKSLHINKAVIEEDLQQGGFVWKARANGNLGLVWKGGTS